MHFKHFQLIFHVWNFVFMLIFLTLTSFLFKKVAYFQCCKKNFYSDLNDIFINLIMKPVFANNDDYYYVGEDAETFVCIKNMEGKKYALFIDENKNPLYDECKISKYKFKFTTTDYTELESYFILVFKVDKNYDIRFDMVAEAFADFLKRKKCLCPVYASIFFADCYFNNPPSKNNSPPKITKSVLTYENEIKCYLLILNFYYFVLRVIEDSRIFEISKFGNIKSNLQNLITMLIHVFPNELKTIKDDFASRFVADVFAGKKKEAQYKGLFIVAYYLLTDLIDIKKFKDLMVFESTVDDDFLKGALPDKRGINSDNFWAFPAFLLISNPNNLLFDDKLDCKKEYRFLKFQENILDEVLNKWIAYFQSEKGFFKKFVSKKGKVADFKVNFYNQEKNFKKNMETFKVFLENITEVNFKNLNEQLIEIQKVLVELSKNLDMVISNIDSYAYEDLRVSGENIASLYTLMYQKTNGSIKAFWTLIKEANVKPLDKSNYGNRQAIIHYIEDCLKAKRK